MKNIKEPVRLRQKQLKDGNISLYLDIYYNGKRKYEFLKLYLVKETSKAEKEQNKTTLKIANSIKAQRIIDVQSGAYDVKIDQSNDVAFFPYFDKLKKEQSTRGAGWDTVRNRLLDYCHDENLTFRHVDKQFCEGWRKYLDTCDNAFSSDKELKEGTKHMYWVVFKIVMNRAVKDGILNVSPASLVDGFKPSSAKRVYLTVEEIKRLSQTECHPRHDILKRAFLFSCLTGLRSCDVKALSWGDVTEENGYTRIIFRQQKTHEQEYLDINRQAVTLMGERGRKEDKVFPIKYGHDHANKVLRALVKKAGIDKHVTFHVSRHTFATMMLTNKNSLYTVSKLLGHKSISTTQIYAKVIDAEKQSAVDSIPDGII